MKKVRGKSGSGVSTDTKKTSEKEKQTKVIRMVAWSLLFTGFGL